MKMHENLWKIYEVNLNVSEDAPNIFGSQSQDTHCQTQPLRFRKLEIILWKNCPLHVLYNSLLL